MNRPLRKISALVLAALALTGCVWQVQMMPRDSGKIYIGTGHGDGFGGGSITITVEGRTYTGSVMRTASNDSFGFFQAYGAGSGGISGSDAVIGGTVYVKALLSSPDNHGLRCDLTGDNRGHLGGICVDDEKRVYDVLASR